MVDHSGGESGTNPGLAALLIVNKVKLFRSRHGAGASTAYSLAVLLGESLRAAAGRTTSRAVSPPCFARLGGSRSLAELTMTGLRMVSFRQAHRAGAALLEHAPIRQPKSGQPVFPPWIRSGRA